MRKKRKLKNLKVVGIVLLIVILGGAAGYLYYQNMQLNTLTDELQTELDANTQTVYVATTYITAGDKLISVEEDAEKGNVTKQIIRTGLEAYNYISEDELGTISLIDIPEGTPVLYNMVTDVEFNTDTRDYELAVVNLALDQMDNDYVDVRIMYPNGEDYIILAKKKVSGLNLENCVFTTTVNEEEILRMSSAIVDAYTTTGAYIYTTRYVDAAAQDEATPTYLVRAENIDLINSDPNVLTKAIDTLNLSARLSLETRLGNLTEDELQAVSDGHGLQDTAKSSVLSAQSSESEDEYAEESTSEVPDADTSNDEAEE